MNEIIKNIEAAQLKAEVPAFNTGDTVRVHALIKEGNSSQETGRKQQSYIYCKKEL